MAIPVQDKGDFECPTEHVNALRESIPKVTKILTIGWRGTEAHFLKLLSQGIQRDIRVMSVSGNLQASTETITNLHRVGIKCTPTPIEGGFTDFVVKRKGDEFLSS